MALSLDDLKGYNIKLPPDVRAKIEEVSEHDGPATIHINDGWNKDKFKCKDSHELAAWVRACKENGWEYEVTYNRATR